MIQAHIRDKKIDVTDIKYILVESDHCDTIQFVMKSTYNGVDLSSYAFLLRWQNVDGEGDDIVLTSSVDDNKIYMAFTPGAQFTAKPGRVAIQIRGSKTVNGVAYNWNSEVANIYVGDLLNPDPANPVDPSVYQQVLNSLADLAASVTAAANSATAAASSASDANQSKIDTATLKSEALSQIGTARTEVLAAIQAAQDAGLLGLAERAAQIASAIEGYQTEILAMKTQVTTDKGAVATDKAAVDNALSAVQQILSQIQDLKTAIEGDASAAESPIALINDESYTIGLVVVRGRTYLSAVPVSS